MVDVSTIQGKDKHMSLIENHESTDATAHEIEQLRDFITFRLSRMQVKLNAQASETLKKYVNLTLVEWRVIAFIAMLQPTGVADLSQQLGHDKSLLSRTVKKLRDKELVVEERDSVDTRRSNITLSSKGLALYRTNLPRMKKRQQALMQGISIKDQEALFRALDLLEENSKLRDFE